MSFNFRCNVCGYGETNSDVSPNFCPRCAGRNLAVTQNAPQMDIGTTIVTAKVTFVRVDDGTFTLTNKAIFWKGASSGLIGAFMPANDLYIPLESITHVGEFKCLRGGGLTLFLNNGTSYQMRFPKKEKFKIAFDYLRRVTAPRRVERTPDRCEWYIECGHCGYAEKVIHETSPKFCPKCGSMKLTVFSCEKERGGTEQPKTAESTTVPVPPVTGIPYRAGEQDLDRKIKEAQLVNERNKSGCWLWFYATIAAFGGLIALGPIAAIVIFVVCMILILVISAKK